MIYARAADDTRKTNPKSSGMPDASILEAGSAASSYVWENRQSSNLNIVGLCCDPAVEVAIQEGILDGWAGV